MPYITTANINTYLNISLQADGLSLVNSLIPAVEKAVDNYCNRTWSATDDADIIERFDGGSRSYYVKTPNIETVTSIKTSKTSSYAGDLLVAANDDYYIYDDHIELSSAASRGSRTVEIIYKSTASTPPADVKQAVIQWVAHLFKSSPDGGKTVKDVSISSMRLSYKVSNDDIPDFVKTVLDRYVLINL